MMLLFYKYKRVLFVSTLLLMCLICFVAGLNLRSDIRRGSIDRGQEIGAVEPSEFAAFINNNIVVDNGKANVLIQNNEKNHNACRVKIYDKSETLLYESDVIPTGYYIENVRLFENLPVGESEGYAVFEVLDDSKGVKSTLRIDLTFLVDK